MSYAETVQFFTEDDVRRLLPMREAIRALRTAFMDYAAGDARNQPRRRLFLPTGAVLHSMAGAHGPYFGTKIYSTHPKHGANFTFLLYEAASGKPLAQFEANYLGQIRTGAVSGLAADILAPEKELVVGVIGSGFQARTQLEAIAAVRPIKEVRVWSRTSEKRDAFATSMSSELDLPISPAPTARDCLHQADIVVTATFSRDPVIETADLSSNALVISVGSNHAQRRELPSDLVRKATIVVDDVDACRIEAGDLLLGLPDAAWSRVIELKNLVSGKTKAGHDDRLIVFKSVGLGLEDVAAAAVVYENATPGQTTADPDRATR